MTKLIIQIPCYNEEATLGVVLSTLPREISGVDIVERLIIDDGSTDRTVEVALSCKVDHVVRLPYHQGLAKAFMAGLEACLGKGADIIINIDADGQHFASDIPELIKPILSGKADIVVGARPIDTIEYISPTEIYLQKLGSWVVRLASSTKIPDAPCGFRAFSRKAAAKLNVFSEYTFTLETIIQAGQNGMAITSVPVRTNKALRPSRLIKGIPSYIMKSASTIIHTFMIYKPFRFFAIPGIISFSLGILISLRFLYFYFVGQESGHIQSVILAALLLGIGFFLYVAALISDLIAVNRKLLEEIKLRQWGFDNKKFSKSDKT